jgi:outer membrane protein assembly factor BamB
MQWHRAVRLLALWACCSVATGVGPAQAASAPCSPGLSIDWTFRAGSPAPAAAQVRGERVFLASQEGAVHALTARGKFLWTYTVEGGLPWGLDADVNGRVYAATALGALYALSEFGAVTWTERSFVRPTGRAVRSELGLLFIPSGRVLSASPTNPGTGWGIDLGSPIASGPVGDKLGRVWLTTRDGTLHRVKNSFFHKRFKLTSSEPAILLGVSPVVSVLQGQQLSVYNQDGALLFARDGVRQAAVTGDFVVGVDQTVSWLEPSSGRVLATEPFTETVSDAPVVGAGIAYVPTEAGVVYALTPDRAPESCVVAAAPLFTPALLNSARFTSELSARSRDPMTSDIVVTAGNGSLAAIRHRGRAR